MIQNAKIISSQGESIAMQPGPDFMAVLVPALYSHWPGPASMKHPPVFQVHG